MWNSNNRSSTTPTNLFRQVSRLFWHKPRNLIRYLPRLPRVKSVPNPYVLRPANDSTKKSLSSSKHDDEKEENIHTYEYPVHVNRAINYPVKKQGLRPPLQPPKEAEEDDDEKVEYVIPLIDKKLSPDHKNRANSNRFSSNVEEKKKFKQVYKPKVVSPRKDDCENRKNLYDSPININRRILHSVKKQDDQSSSSNANSKCFLPKLHGENTEPSLQAVEDDDDEEVEYDIPLTEKNMPPYRNNRADSNFNLNAEKNYQQVLPVPNKLKPNVQQLLSESNLKKTKPKILPKPKFSGISRAGSKR